MFVNFVTVKPVLVYVNYLWQNQIYVFIKINDLLIKKKIGLFKCKSFIHESSQSGHLSPLYGMQRCNLLL